LIRFGFMVYSLVKWLSSGAQTLEFLDEPSVETVWIGVKPKL